MEPGGREGPVTKSGARVQSVEEFRRAHPSQCGREEATLAVLGQSQCVPLEFLPRSLPHDMPSPRIPLETIDMIIDRIWDEPDELDFWSNYGDEYHALCAAALASRALLPRARYNLLKRVSLLKMEHLRSFTAMVMAYPDAGPMVLELVVLSTPQKPSPAESFPPMLAGLLPTLHHLRIRTEIDPVEDLDLRPTLAFHRAAVASLSRFGAVCTLQLFGLRFANFSEFLRLIAALPGLVTLQCMQIWFRNSARHQYTSIALTRPLQLESLDAS
ncbi:hypothetical protein C8Q74DRAFT_355545 [Fomes fomentarius]|nr:hypothetical protein C8Q74DRAFT_355545 [Fomes fomentarius]